MQRYYFDVLDTGTSLGVPMPHLAALQERIVRPASDLRRE
jgi:hypothetical protein